MKLTFNNENTKKDIFLKVFFDIRDSFPNESLSHIVAVYEGLKDYYYRNHLITNIVSYEVRTALENIFEEDLDIIRFFNIDWSEEIEGFLDMYCFDLIREIDKWFENWD